MLYYDFNSYQDDIGVFAVYPDADTGSNTELSYLALGLGGESGEVLEKTKKLIRDNKFSREEVAKELGDVLWYLTRYANAIGYDLATIADMNVKKLSSRQDRGVLQGSGDNR
jgi:NTP pyrophosphatase (non-canonical NTP hydrolase)